MGVGFSLAALVSASVLALLGCAYGQDNNTGTVQIERAPAPKMKARLPYNQASVDIQRYVSEGKITEGREVLRSYLAAQDVADERKAALSLLYANRLVKTGGVDADSQLLQEAIESLQYGLRTGSSRQQAVARNNLAAIALEKKESAEAVRVLSQGYEQALTLDDNAARSRYLFTYARALAENAQESRALELYTESFTADPSFTRSAVAGIRLGTNTGALSEVTDFISSLLRNGELALAEKELRELFGRQELQQNPEFARLVEVLYDLLLAQRTTRQAFQANWRTFLSERRGGLSATADHLLDIVFLGYSPDLGVNLNPRTAKRRYMRWLYDILEHKETIRLSARVSAFMTSLGEIYVTENDLNGAFARYTTAWAIDTTNVTAALYAVNLMTEYKDILDTDSALFDRWTFELFEGKGRAYLGEDWASILRFHTILGAIYHDKQMWGDSDSPRSAIFQLEHALMARERLARTTNLTNDHVPGLYSMLGNAYQNIGKDRDAFKLYYRAANDAFKAKNTEFTKKIISDLIVPVKYTATSQELKHLNKINPK